MANGALSAIRSLIPGAAGSPSPNSWERPSITQTGVTTLLLKTELEETSIPRPLPHPASALIAVQLEQLWTAMGTPSPFYVIEVGAGTGVLARDVLTYSSEPVPGLSPRLGVRCSRLPTACGLSRQRSSGNGRRSPLQGCGGLYPLQRAYGCLPRASFCCPGRPRDGGGTLRCETENLWRLWTSRPRPG